MKLALGSLLFGGCLIACAADKPDTLSDLPEAPDHDIQTFPDTSSDIDLPPPPLDGLRLRMPEGPRHRLFDGAVPSIDLEAEGGDALLDAWPGVADVPWLAGLLPLLPPCGDTSCPASLAGALFLPLEGLDGDARERLDAMGERIVPADAPIADGGVAVVAFANEDAALAALRRLPFSVRYLRDGGPHGAPDLLVVKPLPGLPWPPDHTLAILLTRDLAEDAGLPAGRPDALSRLLGPPAAAPSPRDTLARQLLAALDGRGELSSERLIGLTIARTADPASAFLGAARLAIATEAATLESAERVEHHAGFCVITIDATFPDFQAGTPPFEAPGEGAWRLDTEGAPILARRAPSRVFLTVPEAAPAGATLPVALFVRTGGGGDRPLIDRGVRPTAGGPASPPTGAGPAVQMAEAGWVGATWDGPHGGPRNPGDADEQFLMFNVLNPPAAIGNIQQTALEAALFRRALDGLPVPACDGTGEIVLDASGAALVGHSMGAWVAPLALALDPAFEAAILSGAGGGWIENVAFKERPLHVRPLAELILGYDAIDRTLAPSDPALTLLQWAGEAADPQVYGGLAMTPPRDVLVIQGVVDHYILPPIAAALQVALGLDLAGPALDARDPRLASFTPLADLLAHAGRQHLEGPVMANRDGRTAVVVQLPEDGIEDGHEAFFQQPEARRLLTCFLADLAAGRAPRVDVGGGGAPCSAR